LDAFSNLVHDNCNGIVDEHSYINLMGKWYPNIQLNAVQPPLTVGPFTNMYASFEQTETLSFPFVYADEALSQAAQKKNIGLFLCGFGGDFTISHNGEDVVYELLKRGDFKQATSYFFSLKKQFQLSIFQSIVAFILSYSSIRHLHSFYQKHFKKKTKLPLTDKLLHAIELKGRFGTSKTSSTKENVMKMINSGTIGSILFDSQVKISSHFALECSSPILDKNISEFFLDVPEEQFYLDNKRRSLMRRAMAGIVPQEIQMRESKGPFSPDFLIRVKLQTAYMKDVLNNIELYKGKKYIDQTLLSNYLNKIELSSDEMKIENTANPRQAVWAIKLIFFVKWLEEKGYKM